jgi:hypothetical protein
MTPSSICFVFTLRSDSACAATDRGVGFAADYDCINRLVVSLDRSEARRLAGVQKIEGGWQARRVVED